MGAGGSTLTSADVNNIINQQNFVKPGDLNPYVKSSSLVSYAKASDLNSYLNKTTDKADSTTSQDDNTKWVSPSWIKTNVSATGGADPNVIASSLAGRDAFRTDVSSKLANFSNFQSKIASNLGSDGTFLSGLVNTFNSDVGNAFKTGLIDNMATDGRFKGEPGVPGPAGTITDSSVRAQLRDGAKSLWCADGDICQIPATKTGIIFTGANQILQGFGTTGSAVVNVNDHVALNMGGTLNLARNKLTSGSGSLGVNDGQIRVAINKDTLSNPTDTDIAASALELYGVSRVKGAAATPRKIKMYDEVEVSSNLYVKDQIVIGDRWRIAVDGGKRLYFQYKKDDGSWDSYINFTPNGDIGYNDKKWLSNAVGYDDNLGIWSQGVNKWMSEDNSIMTTRLGDRGVFTNFKLLRR